MERQNTGARGVRCVLGVGLFFCGAMVTMARTTEDQEKHFTVSGKPVVTLNNIVNGRIEVRSWKNPEVVVTSSSVPGKVSIEAEQVGDRIDINASSLAAGVYVVHIWKGDEVRTQRIFVQGK